MPRGIILGKKQSEIDKMAYATMQEVFKSIDFERALKSYEQGKKLFMEEEKNG